MISEMRTHLKHISYCAAAAIAMLTASCTESGIEHAALSLATSSESVTISSDGSRAEITLPPLGGSAELEVKASGEWEIMRQDSEDWLETLTEGNTITVSAGELVSDYTRTALIRLKADGKISAYIEVSQDGTEKASLEVLPEYLEFPETGGEAEVAVSTNRDSWEITGYEEAGWIEIRKTDKSFFVTAKANGKEEQLSTTLKITAGSEINHKECELVVTIAPCTPAHVTPAQTTLIMPENGGSVSIPVTSNREWEVETQDSWLQVSKEGESITVTSTGAPAGETGEITLKATSGQEKSETVITVESVNDPMILEYALPETGLTVAAPVSDTVNCYIDWGDGTGSCCAKKLSMFEYMTHTYESSGTYKVKIYGYAEGLSCDNGEVMQKSKPFITAVETWGAIRPTSMQYGLSGTSIKALPENTAEVLSGVTDFGSAFSECKELETIPEGLFKNTSATTMTALFRGCTSLKEIPDGLLDDASKVTNISTMFENCSSLEKLPAGLFRNMSKVTMANATFAGCSSLSEIPEDLFGNLTEIQHLYRTFENCSSLSSIPAGLFENCKKIANTASCFSGCTGLKGESPYSVIEGKKVHLYERDGYSDTFSPIKSFGQCFQGCTGLDDYGSIPEDWK